MLDAITIDFFKAVDLVPHNQLFTDIAASGVVLRAGVLIREFLLSQMQRVRGKL